MTVNSVCLCVLVLSLLFECGHSNSPCSDILNFYTDGKNVFGNITLQPIETVSYLEIRIKYSVQGDLDAHLGRIQAPDDVLLKYNRGEAVSYRVYFPVISPWPNITQIAVNFNQICPEPVASSPFVVVNNSLSVTQQSTTARSATTTVYSAPVRETPGPENDFSQECGLVSGGIDRIPLIQDGISYERGEIPWLVAIYKTGQTSLKFLCAGTLVSDRHIVTAVHCIRGPKYLTAVKDIVVRIGLHDLYDWSDDIAVTTKVMNATIHEDFNTSTFENNIMILSLIKRVGFNDFIRPVCLWSGNTKLLRIVGAAGVVAGWGDGQLNEPQMLRVPIVSNTECRASNPFFYKVTSENTLCAGSRDGNGPCKGDSGGGLYLLDGGRWRLRGVISLALSNDNACNLNEYVVYTDTAQFLPWIRNVLSQKYFD